MNSMSRFLERYRECKKNFDRDERLALKIQTRYKALLSSIGNKKKVEQESKKTLQLLIKLQKTTLYGFVKDDALRIKSAVKKIRANPRKHKLKYLLASIYLISPGTFELTGIYIFLRYLWKYALNYKNKRSTREI